MAATKQNIGDLLVDNGLLSSEDLEQAKSEQEKSGEPLGAVLAKLGLATESQLKNALELQFGVNYVTLRTEPVFGVIDLIPEEAVRKHLMVPLAREGDRVTLAMVDPGDNAAIDEAKKHLKGLQIKTVVCLEESFAKFITRALGPDKSPSPEKTNEAALPSKEQEESAPATLDDQNQTPEQPEPSADEAEVTAAEDEDLKKADTSAAIEDSVTADLDEEAPGQPETLDVNEAVAAAVLDDEAASQSEASDIKEDSASATAEDEVTTDDSESTAQSKNESISRSFLADPRETATNLPSAKMPSPIELSPKKEEEEEAQQKVETPTFGVRRNDPETTIAPRNRADESDKQEEPQEKTEETALAKKAKEEPIVLLANQILGGAIKRHCSNIHISAGDKESVVQYRLNGVLFVERRLPKVIVSALVARLKMMARLNLQEQKLPQDGHIKVRSSAKEIVCLLSVIPAEHGDNVVIWIV